MDVLPPTFRPVPPRPETGALMATLALMLGEQGSVAVHVTAARHAEGTTTIARELACAAARNAWCQVALLDASLEPDDPTIPGVTVRGREPVLRSGRIGGAPVALGRLADVSSGAPCIEALRETLDWMRSRYTVVVIDGPPVLACREAAVASRVADGTLLVVEAERTSRADIEQARDVLAQLGATMLGVVLNKRQRRVPRFVERMI